MKVQLRGFGDRVVLAAGEDMHTGSHKLKELLDRIARGQEPVLKPHEQASLDDAGKFKRKRGQSEKRTYYASLTDTAVALYHELRAQDPGRSERETIDMVRAEMAHLRTFRPQTIKHAVHRSRHWPAKQRQKNKLK